MLIRYKVILSIVLSLVGLAFTLIVISGLINQIYLATEERNLTTNVLQVTAELNILTSDYLFTRNQATLDQWTETYNSLEPILNRLIFDEKEELVLFDDLKVAKELQKTRFDELVMLLKENDIKTIELTAGVYKEKISQLDQYSQRLAVDAFDLFEQTGIEIRSMLAQAYVVAILAICFLSAIIIFLSGIFYFSLIKPLLNLNDKLRVVAAGDYKTRIDFKTRNELGVVARAFNHMVTELQAQQTEIKSKQQSLIDNQRVLEDQSDAVLNILEDIEEEKMRSDDLAADLKKFKLAADNTSDQVVITDPEGVILYANKSLETISGFAVEDVLGRKVATKELWGGLMEKDFYTQLWNTIKRKKQSFTGLIKNKRKSGEEYYVSATISPILDQKKEVNFFIGIERDVTKEKQIDLAKSEFVSLASHQLRTPLTAINWYMEMLLSSELGDLNSKQKEYAQHAFASNRRMTELVSSLLNVSRLELGTFIIEPKNENIIGIANGVLADLQHLIKIKRLRLVKDYAKNIPKQLKVDKRLLEICFQNLLTNAIKYTPEKGRITFSVEKKNGNIIICVSDTGYGIPRAQQDKIFTKLFRADNIKTVDPDGTGLGLYIVKSIMDHAGGRIWFHSEEKKGTKFYLSFPSTGMRPKKGTKSLD